MDAALQVGDECQYHFPPKDKDSMQEDPILQNLNGLLRSLHPPSPADIQQMHSYLERHRHPSTHIERCRSLFAPIRRLPNEILENVFAMICISEYGHYSLRIYNAPANKRLPHIAPTLTLTHVSYRWRLLINESARLWSSINVAIPTRTMRTSTMKIGFLLNLYLSRSEEHPLDLQFWQSAPTYNNNPIINMVFSDISRIKSLDLSTEPDGARFIPDRFWNAFRTGAPQLSAVKMISPLNPSRIPYHQLKVLEIQQVHDCMDLIRLIPLCTQLHTLKLSISPNSTYNIDTDLRIEASSVRHLSVDVYTEFSFITQQLVFPSLISLELTLYGSISLAPLVDAAAGYCLQKFVLKSYHGLQTSTSELYRFLVSCPELTELRVEYTDVLMQNDALTSKFVEALCRAPTNVGVVVPHLTAWEVYEPLSTIDSETFNALLNMLEKRISALDDNSATVGRSKWDFEFGRPLRCTKEDLKTFSARLESLGRRGLMCRIQGAGNVVKGGERRPVTGLRQARKTEFSGRVNFLRHSTRSNAMGRTKHRGSS